MDTPAPTPPADADPVAALFAAGRFAEAETLLRARHDAQPGVAATCHNLGGALLMQGKVEESLTWYAAALEAQPGWPVALLGQAKAHLSRRRAAEALKALEGVPDAPPFEREKPKLTGIARMMAGDPAGALANLEEYRRRSPPGDEDALRNLAALHAQNRDEAALAGVLEELVQVRPQDNTVHLRLAQALAATGQFTRLNATLDRIERQWPKQADPLEACAAFYEGTRQYALATRCAARARGLDVRTDRHPRLTRWSAWL